LRDIAFVLEEWLSVRTDWSETSAFGDLDESTSTQILDAAAQFAGNTLAPINANGDIEGCQYRDGTVMTPPGFREAYRAYVEAGWPALACAPGDGGQGLPQLLNVALFEMMSAANHAWTMYPGLTHGAYECIRVHGSPWLRTQYLPRLVSGEWLATMCLTEAQAGSDLGQVRTRARPDGRPGDEPRYRISGTKIFISGGEHDLTENIVHLVLARLPDAPAGSRGLSLFVVPKKLSEEGGLTANSVRCDGFELKMGIKGSATCVLTFDDSIGWLVGEPHRGLPAMFVMMNAARLHVGLQGLGHAQAAYQIAVEYARDRVQMRAPPSHTQDAGAPVPIIQHPAMRRKLLRLRACVQGERCIGYWIAHLLDMAEHHSNPDRRVQSAELVSLLTPIAKAFFTENGFLAASDALQVLGGHGYLHGNAIEQTLRDSRVAMIYEGTNEIQAIDLLVRKIVGAGAAGLPGLLVIFRAEADACLAVERCTHFGRQLHECAEVLAMTTETICVSVTDDPELPYRVADDYLRVLGLILLAYAWAKTARIISTRGVADSFYQEKLVTGQFFFDSMLPEVQVRLAGIRSGYIPLPKL
jgi:alkylation response protein AidB-like acyl-CoA dehydrogenase